MGYSPLTHQFPQVNHYKKTLQCGTGESFLSQFFEWLAGDFEIRNTIKRR